MECSSICVEYWLSISGNLLSIHALCIFTCNLLILVIIMQLILFSRLLRKTWYKYLVPEKFVCRKKFTSLLKVKQLISFSSTIFLYISKQHVSPQANYNSNGYLAWRWISIKNYAFRIGFFNVFKCTYSLWSHYNLSYFDVMTGIVSTCF